MSETFVVHPSEDYTATALAVAWAIVARDPSMNKLEPLELAKVVTQVEARLLYQPSTTRKQPESKTFDAIPNVILWGVGILIVVAVMLFYVLS